ncbi:hypothetical protein B7463_g3193, partial [Scytalidium lignicola]
MAIPFMNGFILGILDGRKERMTDGRFSMRIALTQQNLYRAEAMLLQVSHPSSSSFSQYWSPKKVANTFAPSDESLAAVTGCLTSSGISKDYYHYVNTLSGEKSVACDYYNVPKNIRPHIDFTPTIALNSTGKRRRRSTEQPQESKRIQPLQPKLSAAFKSTQIQLPANDLTNYDINITPDCFRALYRIPVKTTANLKNSLAIYAEGPNQYYQADLNVFFRNFSPPLVGRSPNFVSVDGGAKFNRSSQVPINSPLGEAELDLMYSMALTFPPQYDPIYPDPYGYNQTQNCGGTPLPKVISFSYEGNESGYTDLEKQRLCHEFLKLGILGTSVFFASGDDGVAGNGDRCLDPATDGTTFNPEFPATCPYITTVGGTEVPLGSSVRQPEIAMNSTTVTGGGFSNFFAIPDYQKETVLAWFAKHPNLYNSTVFNNTKQTPGYPDVSMNGVNILVGVSAEPPYSTADELAPVSGTSASYPAFASVITLINDARLNAGKTSVRFINPVAYAHPHVFNDITIGNNEGSGTSSFSATEGWDPITGLGTPNFPKLLELYLSLP